MTDILARQAALPYLLPVFCGNSRLAHSLSRRIYRRFGIRSLIVGRRSLWDISDVSSKTIPLPAGTDPRRIAERLTVLASEHPDTLPILIPCTGAAKALTRRFCDELEPCFILTDPATLFSVPPLSDF